MLDLNKRIVELSTAISQDMIWFSSDISKQRNIRLCPGQS